MKRAYWCKKCEVPLISEKCESCDSSNIQSAAKDLTPVFAEELEMLRKEFDFPKFRGKSADGLLWSHGNSYYYRGEKIGHVSYQQKDQPVIQFTTQYSNSPRIRKVLSSGQAILAANRTALTYIKHEAQNFIRSTVSQYGKNKPLVAFSGGKDSTVVSHLVKQAIGADTLHIFLDTTLEASDTYQYVQRFQEENPRTPLIHLRPIVDFLQMCDLIGPPSRIHRWCCTSHKTSPMGLFIELLSKSGGVLTFDGIRSCESSRRARLGRVTTNHKKLAQQISASPISSWSNLELWCYILTEGIDYNFAYRRGFRRVGCLYCPFLGSWPEYMTKISYPQEYEQWKTFLYNYGEAAGLPNPTEFAHDTWKGRARGAELNRESLRVEKKECLTDSSAYNYVIPADKIGLLSSFLTPLGRIEVIHEDDIIKQFQVIDRKNPGLSLTLVVNKQSGGTRCVLSQRSGAYLLQKRFERQVRKLQSCVSCGACVSLCKTGAIQCNPSITISNELCIGCLACVSRDCIVVKALEPFINSCLRRSEKNRPVRSPG